jgi:hypothetical protein
LSPHRLVQSRTNEVIVWLERTRNAEPELPTARAWLASACALNSDIERATTELAQARRLSRDGRYWSIARLMAVGHFGVPKIRALVENTFLAGLRRAGMPED